MSRSRRARLLQAAAARPRSIGHTPKPRIRSASDFLKTPPEPENTNSNSSKIMRQKIFKRGTIRTVQNFPVNKNIKGPLPIKRNRGQIECASTAVTKHKFVASRNRASQALDGIAQLPTHRSREFQKFVASRNTRSRTIAQLPTHQSRKFQKFAASRNTTMQTLDEKAQLRLHQSREFKGKQAKPILSRPSNKACSVTYNTVATDKETNDALINLAKSPISFQSADKNQALFAIPDAKSNEEEAKSSSSQFCVSKTNSVPDVIIGDGSCISEEVAAKSGTQLPSNPEHCNQKLHIPKTQKSAPSNKKLQEQPSFAQRVVSATGTAVTPVVTPTENCIARASAVATENSIQDDQKCRSQTNQPMQSLVPPHISESRCPSHALVASITVATPASSFEMNDKRSFVGSVDTTDDKGVGFSLCCFSYNPIDS